MKLVGSNGEAIEAAEPTIKVTFQGDKGVKLEVPPGLQYGQLVIAASLIQKRAFDLLDASNAAMRLAAEESAAVAAQLAAERRGN